MTVVPAIVRPAGAGDTAEETDLTVEAVIENELRTGLDPVQRALGFQRLRQGGLTIKGIAQRLGGIPDRRVRETLAILDLPEALWPRVADGTVPLAAVKPLVGLAKVHAGLPAVAVGRVLSPRPRTWDEQVTWEDVQADALGVAVGSYADQHGDLPEDVFVGGEEYPVHRFALSNAAHADLEALLLAAPRRRAGRIQRPLRT
jgi:hypothetical protein